MAKKILNNEKMDRIVHQIAHTYKDDSGINFIDATNLPVRSKIVEILELLIPFRRHGGFRHDFVALIPISLQRSDEYHIIGQLR